MEGVGCGRSPRHVAGQGRASCLFPCLAVPQLAPAHSFAAGALPASSVKICFRDEIVGLSSAGQCWGGQSRPWVKDALVEQLLRRFQRGGNLQLDWDALGDEHSNLLCIYYGQQFD